MAATDLRSLPCPSAFGEWASTHDRDSAVRRQPIEVNAAWWNAALDRRRLPGRVTGTPSRGEIVSIERGQIFELAARATSGEAWLDVLWHSLAWGAGTSARNMDRRLDAIASGGEDVLAALVEAANLSRSQPEAAYSTLRPEQNLVKWLGPAFFSKYLYFAGAGRPDHPSLILDARVSRSLQRAGWASLRDSGSWPAGTYTRYCALLSRWANSSEARASAGRDIAADELELWLFTTG